MAKSNMLGASNKAAGPAEVGYMPPPPPEAAPVPVAAVGAAPEPEAPAAPVKPAKAAPSLSAPKKADVTGSGGVVLEKPGTDGD
jgi:hypothetical protein